MNINAMLQQAQKMQKEVMKVKEEIEKKIYEHSNSLVSVKVNGKKEIIQIKIKESIELKNDDKEMIEDMVMLALNETYKKIDDELANKMGKFAPGMSGLF